MSKVSEIRKRELKQLKNAAYLNASFSFTYTCAPFMVSVYFYIFDMILLSLIPASAFCRIKKDEGSRGETNPE